MFDYLFGSFNKISESFESHKHRATREHTFVTCGCSFKLTSVLAISSMLVRFEMYYMYIYRVSHLKRPTQLPLKLFIVGKMFQNKTYFELGGISFHKSCLGERASETSK